MALAVAGAARPVARLAAEVGAAAVAVATAAVVPHAGMGHFALCKVKGRALARLLAREFVSPATAAAFAVVVAIAAGVEVA